MRQIKISRHYSAIKLSHPAEPSFHIEEASMRVAMPDALRVIGEMTKVLRMHHSKRISSIAAKKLSTQALRKFKEGLVAWSTEELVNYEQKPTTNQ